MAQAARQRRSQPSDESASSSSAAYTKVDKPGRPDGGEEGEKGLRWLTPLIALAVLRYMSATSNIIHDCDEVFNYWEPLHFLLYKSGFQTWEYRMGVGIQGSFLWKPNPRLARILNLLFDMEIGWKWSNDMNYSRTVEAAVCITVISQFALRSYLYLLFHELVGKPASWLYGGEKVRVFYAVRLFLGLISVITDTVLVVALSRKYGRRLAAYTLAMLCLTSGCFFASTSFLPSSFSMYAVSLSSGLFLLEKPAMAVSVSVVGVILGWPFSILVFLPVTFYALARKFKQTFLSGAITSLALLALSLLVDYHYYGRWTSSVLNLLIYNVLGGGESHLYGIEGPLYYLRNGFNNFNFCFVLALLFLGILPIVRKKYVPDLLVVISPIYIWLGFMSLQPHKEERFLYPIYPLVCVAASAVIESFPDLFRDPYYPNANYLMVMIAKCLRPVVLGLILCASHARSVVCVGSEWHRFPSSFFIPDYVGEVRWIDDGFRGLLPLPFNSTLGGTSAAPSYFNNKNKASDEQYLRNLEACTFLVELELQRPYPSRGSDLSTWEAVAVLPYLDRELSPATYRSFFIPYLWERRNVFWQVQTA
ncbi:Dol-P-Man:Man(6)GlcNAc(2)-PP-Dol alpha-1,2-mannosyltransferase [Vitis vinifera]|uniref:Mannosyltransferase n=1 Tax=Vitis vinifera TaxID=29760 RepID=A0A438J4I7_VITVI|nr:Dol-P-Man:Man(6)GlcNAc(2)-PP-Dol alpha-1,2-mannosyltransferase [Vitis vinifera]